MAVLYIRDVADETVAAIKARAARNGRSMQKELHAAVEELAAQEPRKRRRRGPLNITPVHTGNTGTWERWEFYADDE
ncbi:MAG TPA: hypothetical protein VF426_01915 [Marmoricola sp.]